MIFDTGVTEFVGEARMRLMYANFEAEYDKALESKEHYWVGTMMYKINPPLEEGHLFDAAMLRSAAFGCYICEQPYSRRLMHRKCTGEPDA